MPTTTNYSWTTPADTDLVKDGASAIRTLGSAIDTTTKNLNPSTTLGDIEYRSSTANTNTRLPIGTSGQVLTVSGGVPAWGAVSSDSLTLLSTTTLSGTSTTISSINQTYKNLHIIITGVNQSATDAFIIYPNNVSNISHNANQFAGGSLGGDETAIRLTGTSSGSDSLRASTTNNSWALTMFNYASTTTRKTWSMNGIFQYDTSATGNVSGATGGGGINSDSAISSLVFRSAGGTATYSGGTVLIYGVK